MSILPPEQDAPLLDHRVKFVSAGQTHYTGTVVGAFWVLPKTKQELRYAVRVNLEGGGATVFNELPENLESIERHKIAPGAKPVPAGLRNPVELSADAKAAGYTGNMCASCFSFRLKPSGTCTVCEDCGSTTGCS